MPSGKTHDGLTILFALPVFAVGYAVLGGVWPAAFLTAAYIFGGMMFGPDLDIASSQQPRWGVLKFVWAPYRWIFKHRSRWSHGLVFGTLLRVIYFMGITTLCVLAVAYVYAAYAGGDLPRIAEVRAVWSELGRLSKDHLGEHAMYVAFAGMWLGAAVHTFADIAVTYIRTGKVKGWL